MKSVKLLLCLALVLVLSSLSVFATAHQTVTLETVDDAVRLVVSTEGGGYAPWEIPELGAGERLIEPGKITLKNLTAEEADVELAYVSLPFENANALIYLNHLNITVREGDETLYDGPYSRINDTDGLKFKRTLAPEEEVELTVDLRRDYYPIQITGFETCQAIEWKFRSVKEVVIDPNAEETKPTTTKKPDAPQEETDFDDPALTQTLLAAGAAVALIGIVLLVRKARPTATEAPDEVEEDE